MSPSLRLSPQQLSGLLANESQVDVRRKLERWGKRMSEKLRDAGVSLDSGVETVELERLTYIAYLLRGGELFRTVHSLHEPSDGGPCPSERERHAHLGVSVDGHGIQVGLGVGPLAKVDTDNLRLRLEDKAGRDELVGLLGTLPTGFEMRTDSDVAGCDQPDAAGEVLRLWSGQSSLLWVGWRLAANIATEHGDVGGDVADAMFALLPTYQTIAWSSDNDWVQMGARIDDVRRARAVLHARAAQAMEKWRNRRGSDASINEGAKSIASGVRVRIKSGPFAERVAVVSEPDGRGGAWVRLGLLSQRFDLEQLEPMVETRPNLSSSHRKTSVSRKMR